MLRVEYPAIRAAAAFTGATTDPSLHARPGTTPRWPVPVLIDLWRSNLVVPLVVVLDYWLKLLLRPAATRT